MPSNPSDLRAVGDTLQSVASRMAEFIIHDLTVPEHYEVYMAALEARQAVEEWTALRRQDAR